MKMRKYWYLGLLGLIGFYRLPLVIDYLQGADNSWLVLTNLLWFLWFLDFIPEETDGTKPNET
ncbi:hypothetical protein [Aestuariispira ectoiniformans]|uniref:hypothetical protein n=1 Tax=Aestuariispira ectoiniformans TaxID=2775080 RepID=UPI00223B7CC1|nr:hypothetical protein [Aestuariispira ectoiniformans]